jgi:uncharacterized membrane protein
MTRPGIGEQFPNVRLQPPGLLARRRIQSIDALCGLVMIIMALDHVREFFHYGAMSFQPDDLSRTTAVLFFTRWVTHICAPVFAFTAGLGVCLRLKYGGDTAQVPRFLWTRGLWLVLLDLVVIRFAMFFSLTSGPVILSVLWSLGWSMVVLAFLVRTPARVAAVFSVAVILLHNLADGIPAAALGPAGWVWNIMYQTAAIPVHGAVVITAYPLLPWIAVMAAGYCFGRIILVDEQRCRSRLVRIGISLILAFVILRLLNFYGDPQPWSVQPAPGKTVLSFLRTTKYPPSLEFLLMTLGPAMLIWAWLDRVLLRKSNPLLVFGRVPLFYFIVHLYVIHALAYLFALVRYGSVEFLKNPLPSLGGPAAPYPPGFGYDLPVVYVVWILVVALMSAPCRHFARLKERRREWWLSYF